MQNQSTAAIEGQTFRVVVLRHLGSEVLLAANKDEFSLPRVTIPSRQRIVECITERVTELWNLKTVCLFHSNPGDTSASNLHRQYAVMEQRDSLSHPSVGLEWCPRDRVNKRLQAFDDISLLRESLESADAYRTGCLPGPFGRIGWFDDLVSWAQDQLSVRGLRLTGHFRQLNGLPFFTLIRLETNGLPLWFKAVGEPNLHEYQISTSLSDKQPRYFPRVVAVRPDWHGWLMQEVDGVPLGEVRQSETWFRTAKTLGKMQVDFACESDWLLTIGCRDFRIPTVLKLIDPFLDLMTEVMRRQSTTRPAPLSASELQELGAHLKRVCVRLQDLGIPNSLGHCDLNAGNILVNSSNQIVFLDWAEAYVGPPLATGEYLRLVCQNLFSDFASWQDSFVRSYLNNWETTTTVASFAEALLLTPTIAVLLKALSAAKLENRERYRDPGVEKSLRSLTRRMLREALNTMNGAICAAS